MRENLSPHPRKKNSTTYCNLQTPRAVTLTVASDLEGRDHERHRRGETSLSVCVSLQNFSCCPASVTTLGGPSPRHFSMERLTAASPWAPCPLRPSYTSAWMLLQRQQLALDIFTIIFLICVYVSKCQSWCCYSNYQEVSHKLFQHETSHSPYNKTERQSSVLTLGKWLTKGCFHRTPIHGNNEGFRISKNKTMKKSL